MYRKQLIIIALATFFAQTAMGEVQDVYWEIGKTPTVSVPREPGEYRIVVVGRVKGAAYQGEVALESIEIPVIAERIRGPGTHRTAAAPIADEVRRSCQPYNDKLAALLMTAKFQYYSPDLTKATAEEDFWNAVTALRTAIEHPVPGCVPDPLAKLTLAQLVEQSSWELGTYTLKRGQVLTAKVSRKLSDSQNLKFEYEISAGKRGTWMASFGFGISPNNDEHYFSKESDDDTFLVTKKHENGGVNPTAAVFYTWLPKERELSNWNHGVAAGIGVDQSNLALYLGYHVTFNQNIGLVIGVALHQETRLRGEFDAGQSLTESLTSDALEEKVMKPALFLGLTMRFAAEEK